MFCALSLMACSENAFELARDDVAAVNSEQENEQDFESLNLDFEEEKEFLRLSGNPYEAVKLECFYALNPKHDGTSSKSLK